MAAHEKGRAAVAPAGSGQHTVDTGEGITKPEHCQHENTPAPEFATLADLAAILRISTHHAKRLHLNGRLPAPTRYGRCVRWNLAELRAWFQAGSPPREKWGLMRKAALSKASA